MSQKLQAVFAEEGSEPDWSDRAAVIDYIVEGQRPFAGSRPFDEAAIHAIAARVFDRTTNLTSSITNHAVIGSGDRWRERLGEVNVPTLVIHGTEDPMYPYGNAVALAKEIPGAQLLALERVPRGAPSGSVGRCRARHIAAHGVCALSRRRLPRDAIRSWASLHSLNLPENLFGNSG
jgi:pimeloyl-ACP methyl ester carboxylesterase